ncbi:hypothetical protein [Phytohabitans kaempferiae]|uniref:BioF2-like acetyltransferase domain-containing protein n=1 Tax=Phytohabitans kaempferiae TaxID=1620943 RepID=A0ABV6LZ14_9ACTN
MLEESARATAATAAAPDRVLCPDSMTRVLVTATARALHGRDCGDLGRRPMLARYGGVLASGARRAAARTASQAAVPLAATSAVDADDVARWIVGQYPRRSYPAVIVGSPHGAAAHLATAAGVPWLPSGFEMAVQWPDGSPDDPNAALTHGAAVAARLLAANPALTIRQVHDPVLRGVLAGSTVSLHVRWQHLPDPYREFLSAQLDRNAAVIVVRDMRTWPVLDVGAGHTFQLGSPASGLDAAEFRTAGTQLCQALRYLDADRVRWRPPTSSCPERYTETGVEAGFEESVRAWARARRLRLHRVLYAAPEAFSAAVADLHRQWLRGAGKTGNRLVVESGRLLDPAQVLRAGMVPYWCETPSSRAAMALSWWLAGSTTFSSVDVLVDGFGVPTAATANPSQWNAAAKFGAKRAAVDPAATNLAMFPLPVRHATAVLRSQAADLPPPPPLTPDAAMEAIGECAATPAILVC